MILKKAFTADSSGYIVQWDPLTGDTKSFKGVGHTTLIKQIISNNGKLISVAIDDSVKFSSIDSLEFGESISLGGQPQSVSAQKEWTVVVTSAGLVVLKGNQITNKQNVTYNGLSVAISPDASTVAVGTKEGQIHVYSLNGGSLKEAHVLSGHAGEITALAYSHDGKYLGSADSNREVKVWDGTQVKSDNWVFHTSRVQSLAWSPDNNHLATGSVDSHVFVWNVAKPSARVQIKLAHLGGVRAVGWQDADTVLSAGEDCAMKSWTVTY